MAVSLSDRAVFMAHSMLLYQDCIVGGCKNGINL